MSLTIDAHQHFWDRSRTDFDHTWQESEPLRPICRSFMPQDLKPHIDRAGVDRTIFVQTQHNVEENRWVLELASNYDFVAGVVGWVDLTSPDCESQLLEFKDNPLFVGVRHLVHDEPDENFIVREDVVRGLQVLEKHSVPFDLLFFARHLRHAPELARRMPDLPMVIDHLSKPDIKHQNFAPWRSDLTAAARCDNIYCKLSGMVTEADWDRWRPADLQPYVDTALNLFGPNRCMFGSDWPVCELAASYQQVHDALGECLAPLSQAERAAIWGGTAERFYGLPDA